MIQRKRDRRSQPPLWNPKRLVSLFLLPFISRAQVYIPRAPRMKEKPESDPCLHEKEARARFRSRAIYATYRRVYVLSLIRSFPGRRVAVILEFRGRRYIRPW